MERTFKVGDVVQFKSGGPKFTVSQVGSEGQTSEGMTMKIYPVPPQDAVTIMGFPVKIDRVMYSGIPSGVLKLIED